MEDFTVQLDNIPNDIYFNGRTLILKLKLHDWYQNLITEFIHE